jgi:outer membrane protein assembly factor BamB
VQPEWASAGQNNHNIRHAATEHTIDAGNVGSLKPKWTFTTAGDVSATATVVNGVAYVPDWGGKLWAIDTKTGKAIWSHDISDYTLSSSGIHLLFNALPGFGSGAAYEPFSRVPCEKSLAPEFLKNPRGSVDISSSIF